jgi:hypothetical protein
MSKKIAISEFRAAVRLVNHVRDGFYGHVEFERLRTNIRENFVRSTTKVNELMPLVGKRFEKDLEDARWALEKAEEQIERNEASQRDAIKNGVRGEIYNPDQALAA